MSLFDFNNDGKLDAWESYIEYETYQAMNKTTKKKTNTDYGSGWLFGDDNFTWDEPDHSHSNEADNNEFVTAVAITFSISMILLKLLEVF